MCGVVGVLTVLLLLPTQYTAGEIVKIWCQEFDIYLLANIYTYIYIDIDITLSISDMDFLHQFNLRLHHIWGCFSMLKKKNMFLKLAGLWLVGEVVNHVRLYGSKVAEGCSAFQRRSCLQSGDECKICQCFLMIFIKFGLSGLYVRTSGILLSPSFLRFSPWIRVWWSFALPCVYTLCVKIQLCMVIVSVAVNYRYRRYKSI